MKNLLTIWKKVFSDWKAIPSAIIIALGFYFFNVFISNINNLQSAYSHQGFVSSINFFLILSWSFKSTVALHTYVSLIIVSILIGVLFSLIIYKVRAKSTIKSGKAGIFGTVGVFLAALAPGCAACGIGILSAFGIGAAFINFLPYEGMEISILAIGILVFAVYKTTKDMNICEVCQIKLYGSK